MSPDSTVPMAMTPSSSSSSSSGAPASSHRDLRALPLEILDNIGYFAALAANPSSSSAETSYAAPPPQALRDLLLTCRHVNDHLSVSVNPRLYARVFRAKFDLEPIARRYGRKATTVENLAGELSRRCVVLKRIKRAVELGQLRPEGETEEGEIELRENMWLAYLMMTENDGNNLEALLWAGIRSYLSLHHTQEMLRSALQPGYPPESEDRALAMHLSHLLSDASLLATESKEDADEKLFVLRPYVFASHKFNGFYAPWPLRSLPLGAGALSAPAEGVATAPGQTLLERNRGAPVPMPAAAEVQTAPATTSRPPPAAQTNPFLADHTPEDRSTIIRHVGQTLDIRPPCIVHAAYHLFFGQVERNPGLVGLTAITRRGPPPGSEPAGATNGTAGNPAPQTAAPVGSPPRQTHADPMRLKSTDHDRDVMRLLRCHSPMRGPGLKPCFFAGIVDGAWEGRFSFFCFDSYREMLAGRMRSLYEGPFGEQPQVWKLREHFLRVDESGTGNGKREGGLGSMVNAGFPTEEPFEDTLSLPGSIEELHEREREVAGTSGKRRGSISTHSEIRREPPSIGSFRPQGGRQPIAMMLDDKYSEVLRAVQHDDVLPPDLGLYPQFSAEDGGPTAGYGYLPSPPRSRSRLLAQKGDEDEDAEVDEGRYEMLVSGSGHSAWGSFVLRGRIRAWDGMLILSKEYRPDGRGRWLYRGYITAGGCLIGRWRDSFTPGDMSGYEGPFVLNRRSTGGEEV